jgi:thioredoxin 2
MNVVCPHCSAINRVQEDRIDDRPVCARCGSPLLQPEPFELNDETFARYVERTDLPVLVDFWADWCGPCKVMAPQFAAAAAQLPNVRFAKVNTEIARATSAQYAIRSIPTLALFRGGREVARQAGAMSAADLVRWVRSKA